MNSVVRSIGFLIAGFLIGEVVQRLLRSGAGRIVTEKLGHPELSTCDGAAIAKKDTRRVVGVVKGIVEQAAEAPTPPVSHQRAPAIPHWAILARDAAEMLLAAGGVLKTVADFIQTDEQLRRRIARFAGR